MANSNGARGLRPIDPNAVTHSYGVASSNSAINRHDPVKLTSTGKIDLADAGDRVLGSAGKYVAASTADNERFPVFDDCKEFEIQSDGATVEADIGQLANHVAGTGVGGESRVQLDYSGQGTSEAQYRILGKIDRPDNNWGEDYVKLRVELYMKERSTIEPATPGV